MKQVILNKEGVAKLSKSLGRELNQYDLRDASDQLTERYAEGNKMVLVFDSADGKSDLYWAACQNDWEIVEDEDDKIELRTAGRML
jgi:hypothetical protein